MTMRNTSSWRTPHPGFALLCLLIVGCTATDDSAATLAEVIDRHTEARGGKVAIEAIRELEVELQIVEPTYTANGIWRGDRQGRMHIDVFMDGQRVFTEAYDGANAWQWPGGEAHGAPASTAGAAALRRSGQLPVNILGLHEMADHGHRLEFAGREAVDGVSYYVIVLTLDDGFATRYYLDPASMLITRARVRKALHPDVDPTETTIETVWSDFREVAGTQYPFKSTETDLATGKLLQTVTVLNARANVPAEEAQFKMP
jgi:hypothetical protein